MYLFSRYIHTVILNNVACKQLLFGFSLAYLYCEVYIRNVLHKGYRMEVERHRDNGDKWSWRQKRIPFHNTLWRMNSVVTVTTDSQDQMYVLLLENEIKSNTVWISNPVTWYNNTAIFRFMKTKPLAGKIKFHHKFAK